MRAVRAALDALDVVLGHSKDFDPSQADCVFRICMTDISQLVLLPRLWKKLRSGFGVGLHTDLLITIAQRLGDVLEGRGAFRIFPEPFALPGYDVKQHWHERYHHDPGSRWLRGVISELLSESLSESFCDATK